MMIRGLGVGLNHWNCTAVGKTFRFKTKNDVNATSCCVQFC